MQKEKLEPQPFVATWEEHERWHERAKKLCPWWYFFHQTIPLFFSRKKCQLGNAYRWVRGHLWDHYNRVQTRYLPPTWIDRDLLLFAISFQILEDFIEKERPDQYWAIERDIAGSRYHGIRKMYDGAYLPEDQINSRAQEWDELGQLYDWWKARRIQLRDSDEDDVAVDTEKLAALVRLRGHLWT